MRFPTVRGSNLLREKIELPAGFEGELNVVLVAFQQWQQRLVDTAIQQRLIGAIGAGSDLALSTRYALTEAGRNAARDALDRNMNILARTFVNEGMRAGIPDPKARERTITLYLDKPAFRETLDLPVEDDIYVLLVDREGDVVWRASGAFAPDKGESLRSAVQSQLTPLLV